MTDVGNDAAVALPFEEWPPEQPYYIPYEDWGDANLKLTSHIAQIGWERQSSWSPYYSQPIPEPTGTWLCELCFLYTLACKTPPGMNDNKIYLVPISSSQDFCDKCHTARHTTDSARNFIVDGNVRGVGPITRDGFWYCWVCVKRGIHDSRIPLRDERCALCMGAYQPSFRESRVSTVGGFLYLGVPPAQYACKACLHSQNNASLYTKAGKPNEQFKCRGGHYIGPDDGIWFHNRGSALNHYTTRVTALQSIWHGTATLEQLALFQIADYQTLDLRDIFEAI